MAHEVHALPMPPDVRGLAAEYDRARAAEAAAKERKDALGAALKVAAEQARILAGLDPSARLMYEADDLEVSVVQVEAWRVDSKRLKSEQPAVYATYAAKSVSTRLEVKTR